MLKETVEAFDGAWGFELTPDKHPFIMCQTR